MAVDLLKELPRLVSQGLVTAEQAERIKEQYAAKTEEDGNRLLAVFAVLGSLLVGLGIILLIAHNWDDLPRGARTVLAYFPVLLGQGLVFFALTRKGDNMVWREGSALLLACGLCACVALISQIYHVSGELEGYLLTCCLLMLPLLYLPGSVMAGLAYLSMITWYVGLVRFEHWRSHDLPLWGLGLALAAVPAYLIHARKHGMSIGFWWNGLFLALAIGLISQFYHADLEVEQALAIVGIASAFTLIPWLHRGRELRTHPWVFVGGLTVICTFFVFSSRRAWEDVAEVDRLSRIDGPVPILACLVVGLVAYVLSIFHRKPFEAWPYPEAFPVALLCYGIAYIEPLFAAIAVNVALLVMGALTVKRGIEIDSLKRMNLGLSILGLTVLIRFFDSDLSFVVRGIAFIVVGAGFLYMNLRLVKQRKQQRHGE